MHVPWDKDVFTGHTHKPPDIMNDESGQIHAFEDNVRLPTHVWQIFAVLHEKQFEILQLMQVSSNNVVWFGQIQFSFKNIKVLSAHPQVLFSNIKLPIHVEQEF